MRLLLVRHAESEWNALGRLQGQADPPLSPHGRQQAAQMAARLVEEPIDAIVASDLQRAQATAHALAETLAMEVEPRAGLREVDLGNWTGIDRDHLQAEFPEAWRLWRERGVEGWEGGERYGEAIVRIAAEIAEIAARYDGRTVVAVTHGGCVRLATCHLLGMPAGEFGRIASIGNSSITEFLVDGDGRGRLVRLNDIAHLLQPTAADDLEPR
jgi:broad specificity phosphatase PhoE